MTVQRQSTGHGDEGLPIFERGFQAHAIAGVERQPGVTQIQDALEPGQKIIEVVQRRAPKILGSHAFSACTKALNKVTLDMTLCAVIAASGTPYAATDQTSW